MNVKSVSKNKLVFVALGLGFVGILGYVVSDLNQRESGRSLASNGFSFDKELSDLASKRVIQEMQTGRDVELGSAPSRLEKFLFEDLKGEFSLEVEPERAFRLTLINGSTSSVTVGDQQQFVKEALGFLFEDKSDYKLVEKIRVPASSLSSEFSVVDASDDIQAEVVIEVTDTNHLKLLTVRKK